MKGLNFKDPLADMPRGYGIRLDNFFPNLGEVRVRKGSTLQNTVQNGQPVETIVSHVSGTSATMIVAAGDRLYLVPENPTWPARSLATGLRSARWQSMSFGDSTFIMNGRDTPRLITGTGRISTMAHTGDSLDVADLIAGTTWQNRGIFIEKDTARLWYTGVKEEASGTLRPFDLHFVDRGGGNAVAIANFTIDGGDGLDDHLAVFMDSGAVLLYRGSDISSADNVTLAGRFHMSKVLGPRAVEEVGSDVIAMTEEGFISLKSFLAEGDARQKFSDNVNSEIVRLAEAYGDDFGWQSVRHAPGNFMLFNIPGRSTQYVRNLDTGAWCRFLDLDARCWAEHDGKLFFGSADGKVVQANTGDNDQGEGIHAVGQTRYSRLRTSDDKDFEQVRPHLAAVGTAQYRVGGTVDYTDVRTYASSELLESSGAKWNESKWGPALNPSVPAAKWAGGLQHFRQWTELGTTGTSLSILLELEDSKSDFRWYTSDVMFTRRAGLG